MQFLFFLFYLLIIASFIFLVLLIISWNEYEAFSMWFGKNLGGKLYDYNMRINKEFVNFWK